MKSTLQSIRPQYCELIAAGKKTIEVRKTRPKLDVPFKVYIYETKFINHCRDCEYCSFESIVMSRMKDVCRYEEGNWKITNLSSRCFQNKYSGGKVIGEYVCDEIIEWTEDMCPPVPLSTICLSYSQIRKYGGSKTLYLWHISDLKIYDKPKELIEFYHYCGDDPKCESCPYLYVESNESIGTYEECCSGNEGCKPLTRPPQSWCYVEEVAV